MPLWLLLADKAKGYALELHPAPTQWNRPPRPFSPGAEGENFTDFALHWLSDTPSKNAQTWGESWREPLDKNDPLQRSALKSGALAYRLLYHSVDNPLRQQCSVRFQLDEAELLAQGGGRGISGESGDLLFALAVVTVAQPRAGGYLPLAATGVLDDAGRVKYVAGVADKLKAYLTAIANLPKTTPVKTDGNDEQAKTLFFHPRANDDDLSPELRKTAHQAGVQLIAVERLEEALCALGITVKDYWEGNPYRCFDFFDTVHRRIFFGRETESAIACETLLQREKDGTPGILVFGSSGRGKSSLVRAGVIPRLQKHEALLDRPIFFHSWRLPDNKNKDNSTASDALLANTLRQAWAHLPEFQYMETAQDGATQANTLSALADDLAKVLPQTQRFVWVIDQMEELFTNYPDATIEAFGAFLNHLQTLGVWPIATLRSEYGHAYQNTNLLDVFGNGYILPKMHETVLELAIRKPATLAKLDFETDPVTGINLAAHIRVEALQGGEDMLPLLGFVLSELYEDPERIKQNDGWLRWEAYRRLGGLHDASQQSHEQQAECKPDQNASNFSKLLACLGLRRKENPAPRPPLMSHQALHIGGLAGAVGHHANKLLSACTIEERNALPKVLLHLVRLSEDGNEAVRQRVRLNAFVAGTQQAILVNKLIDGRLLISNIDAETQEPTIELVHDCLLTAWDKVGAVIEQHRELLEEKRKLSNAAKHWERNGRPERLLINKVNEVMHAEALVCCLNNEIDNITQSYLQASLLITRTGFRFAWVLIVVLVVVLGIYIVNDAKDILMPFVVVPSCLILSLPALKRIYRSINIKPYKETAKTDIAIDTIYSLIYAAFIYYSILRQVIDGENNIYNRFDIILRLLSILPIILTVRGAIKNQYFAKSIKSGSLFYGNRFKESLLFFPSVRGWFKIEVAVWVYMVIFLYGNWGQWNDGRNLMIDVRSYSLTFFDFLQERTFKLLASNNIDEAKDTLDMAYKYSGFYSSSPFELLSNNRSEHAAKVLAKLYLGRCTFNISVLKECNVAIDIARQWVAKNTNANEFWQSMLAASLAHYGRLRANRGMSLGINDDIDAAMSALMEAKQIIDVFLDRDNGKQVNPGYKRAKAVILKRLGDINKYKNMDGYLELYDQSRTILVEISTNLDTTMELLDLYVPPVSE